MVQTNACNWKCYGSKWTTIKSWEPLSPTVPLNFRLQINQRKSVAISGGGVRRAISGGGKERRAIYGTNSSVELPIKSCGVRRVISGGIEERERQWIKKIVALDSFFVVWGFRGKWNSFRGKRKGGGHERRKIQLRKRRRIFQRETLSSPLWMRWGNNFFCKCSF